MGLAEKGPKLLPNDFSKGGDKFGVEATMEGIIKGFRFITGQEDFYLIEGVAILCYVCFQPGLDGRKHSGLLRERSRLPGGGRPQDCFYFREGGAIFAKGIMERLNKGS